MTNLSDLRPGDILTTPTYGNLLDRTLGRAIRFGTATQDPTGKWVDAPVNHAAIYLGGGKIVEAQPGGAAISAWDKYGNDAVWSVNGLGQRQTDGSLRPLPPLTSTQRDEIAGHACQMVGTPYGYLDIVAIGIGQRRMHLEYVVDPAKPLADQPWWVRRITSPHTLICSQLADLAYARAGIELFADNRLPGLVSPNDIRGLYLP